MPHGLAENLAKHSSRITFYLYINKQTNMENKTSEQSFLEWRDKIDAFLLTKKGTLNIKNFDKVYDEYCESIANCNREALEAQCLEEEDDYVPDQVEDDEEPMTFEEYMEGTMDAFDEASMKCKVFDYSTENEWPSRNAEHPWPKGSNDLSTVMAIYIVEYLEMDPEEEVEAVKEFEEYFTTSIG